MMKYLLMCFFIGFAPLVNAQTARHEYRVSGASVTMPAYIEKDNSDQGGTDSTVMMFVSKNHHLFVLISIAATRKVDILAQHRDTSLAAFHDNIVDNLSNVYTGRDCKAGKSKAKTMNGMRFIETEIVCRDTREGYNEDQYLFAGVAAVNGIFYRFVCTSPLFSKDRFSKDFRSVFYSLRL